ncbi:hypothetical protein ABZ208_23270 [Streptomyces sp. NPDC006208]|uniref:hypothetical protein n=1 Tax=Streptomyces sp. NPDC006208 TaxID=3156734 RepID=UPI0033BA03A2
MERERTAGPTGGGLSTDDLAAPREQDTRQEPAESSQAPEYPGESTEAATEPEPAEAEALPADDEPPQLLVPEDEEGFHARWQEIQSRFVDDPREAVHAADGLVADVMQTLAATFSQHKKDLEGQWNRGEEADTEDLRMALRKYRSFFNRLLSS